MCLSEPIKIKFIVEMIIVSQIRKRILWISQL